MLLDLIFAFIEQIQLFFSIQATANMTLIGSVTAGLDKSSAGQALLSVWLLPWQTHLGYIKPVHHDRGI